MTRYDDDGCVLVLPMLGPVAQSEFRAWHRQLMMLAADSAIEGDLATMTLDLFPGEIVQRHMGEIWDPMRKAIQEAWA